MKEESDRAIELWSDQQCTQLRNECTAQKKLQGFCCDPAVHCTRDAVDKGKCGWTCLWPRFVSDVVDEQMAKTHWCGRNRKTKKVGTGYRWEVY